MRALTTVERRLQKARTTLLLDHPFFGSLLFRLKGRESRSIKTMATDGVSLFYNPDFVDTLNAATLCGVLAHEVLHPGLQHHVRRSGRDPKRWNEACDYAINPILLDAGLHLPEGVLVDDRFREMSAEQIYNQLQTEAEQEPGDPGDTREAGGDGADASQASLGDSGEPSAPETEGGIGQVLDAPTAGEETPTAEEQAREWSVAVNQAVTVAKQAGKVPAGVERTLDGAAEAAVDWRELLRRAWSETTPADYSWMRPNRRHIWNGLYPSDVTEEEWEFVLPYLLLCREDSPQRRHDLRRVFNGVRYAARTGGQWRYLPHEYGPWWAVYQQMRRRLDAGVFEALVADVQSIVREWAGRKGQPTAVCLDSRTLQSTPESGARAGYDGAKRRKGSKVHIAVDTLGHLLALKVTAADRGDREQVASLAAEVQEVTGSTVELAYVDQGYTGPNAAEPAQQHGIRLEVVKHPMAKRGFVLLPRRWVVERSFAWAARFRRLARDYERLETSLKGFHYILRHPHDQQTHQRSSYKYLTASSRSRTGCVRTTEISPCCPIANGPNCICQSWVTGAPEFNYTGLRERLLVFTTCALASRRSSSSSL